MYIAVFSFIVCSAVMVAGQGLYNYRLCFGATWICLILYTVAKFVIYVFLVERIHVVRAPFVRRSRDWLYLSCLVLMSVSFLAVAVNAYLSPIIIMEADDGRCHMGIPGKASIPFMSVDIVVDVVLTSVFIYLLRPVVKMHGLNKTHVVRVPKSPILGREEEVHGTAMRKSIRKLLWKSLIGSLLIMIPTIANMIQFYIMQGRELALICLTLCTLDGKCDCLSVYTNTWQVLTI
ncbi:hypothetical protein P171DRAFT_354953 [Karstenula rhodostoma CBS 690.94]|uniref:Uncharacterized protein n=1 Tax=Karstenula rhodostoma CBS 690.94 TaxID=1392251 RepID=A0A9P4UFN1_9PLEO|nr:hypothetical protein P171DRAFT_354953 [Karstenula rhodostoma CBS 690.94]